MHHNPLEVDTSIPNIHSPLFQQNPTWSLHLPGLVPFPSWGLVWLEASDTILSSKTWGVLCWGALRKASSLLKGGRQVFFFSPGHDHIRVRPEEVKSHSTATRGSRERKAEELLTYPTPEVPRSKCWLASSGPQFFPSHTGYCVNLFLLFCLSSRSGIVNLMPVAFSLPNNPTSWFWQDSPDREKVKRQIPL